MNHRNLLQLALVISVPALLAAIPVTSFGQPASGQTVAPSVSITVANGVRRIVSNGIPDHPTGTFPNPGNPNRIAPQRSEFSVPVEPKPAPQPRQSKLFGVAINGIPFDPGTAEMWNGDPRWRFEALSGFMASRGSLGMDENLAHVQPTGAYHYHGMPMGLLKRLDYTRKMALVGYAADGYPIYGPYAYSQPNDPNSSLQEMKSSYRLRTQTRPAGNDGPGGIPDGSFEQDYEYRRAVGTLDEFNGRTGVTPEYPKGTFYYVLTRDWPFIPRLLKGNPDASFLGGPGGPGGPGRPGAGQRAGRAPLASGPQGIYVLQGDRLLLLDPVTLKVISSTELPTPKSPPAGGRGR